jgi:nitroreductase
MDLYNAIYKRRTIRDFIDKEVPMETIERILDAGMKAPTNDHMRNWEFVVISDKEERLRLLDGMPARITGKKIERVLDTWKMTDECQRAMYIDAIPKQFFMLYNASCLILPFFRQDAPLLKPDSLSALNGFASIWCCIENILLAAAAEGLYVALRIPFDKEAAHIHEVLKNPDNYIMPCYLAIGYPSENAAWNPQKEYNIKEKIHINKW